MIRWFLLTVFVSLLAAVSPRERIVYNSLLEDSDSEAVGVIFDTLATYQRFGRRTPHLHRRQAVDGGNTTVEDHHEYYTSRYIKPGIESDNLWFELGDLIGSGGDAEIQTNVTESVLEGLHRSYELWDLKFDFPYYGHIVSSLAVTTGGFLYTGSFLHSRIHLTQFIAPLQADFNPSKTDVARILVYNTANRFTAQWDKVNNHDHEQDGPFTFQVSLFPNGTIYFVYRKIPLLVNAINNDDHPVEVGLADAFYYDVRRGPVIIRYIYEYSRVQLSASSNLSYSAYIIDPVPNCVIATNCSECSSITELGIFDCAWCPVTNRCSDGLDRHTQQWIDNGCPDQALTTCHPISLSSSSSLYLTISSSSLYLTISSSSLYLTISSSLHLTKSSSLPSVLSSLSLVPSDTFLSSRISATSSSSSSLLNPSPHPSPSVLDSVSLTSVRPTTSPTPVIGRTSSSSLSEPAKAGIGVVLVVIVLIILAISIVAGVLIYGYKRPRSKIGMFMIKHRPSARSLNKTTKYEMKSEKILLE